MSNHTVVRSPRRLPYMAGSLVSTAALAAAVVPTASAGMFENHPNPLQPPTYITGIGGKLDVTVTSKAIEELPAKIVEAQVTEGVDGVSGATVTSKAIFKAVDAAPRKPRPNIRDTDNQ